jgi:transposase-like protein
MNWDTCVKDYLKMVANGCPDEFRPTWCEHCQSEAKFHKLGSFTRSVLTMEELLEITIFRFKCTLCGKTRGILPSFLRRNYAAALDVQEHVVRRHEEGVSLRVISEQLPSLLAFSEKTLWRWKNYWKKLLDRLNPGIWHTVLSRFPHLLLPRGSDTPSSVWDWVFWVWGKTRLQWTGNPANCFQWLTFLSQSGR